MLINLIAALLILIGIAGLVLPIMPGILLITIGILLFYRKKHEDICRLVNEKAPPVLADFYNTFLHKIMLPPHYVDINWDWVRKEVLRSEKINVLDKGERAGRIRAALDISMRKARCLIRPRYIFEEKKISALGADFIEIEGGTRFNTAKIPHFISGAERLVFLLVTIGPDIEKEASQLTSGDDTLSGYLLDRIGSYAVESLAENLEKRLRKNYSLIRKSVSSRFSPGYCDWPIEEQFKLAKVIDFSKAGVELNSNCMMIPKKSVSALVAVADAGVFKEFVSSCDICANSECDFRRNS